ncbi:efflux RND transporter periplasmic adaptor subunit [Oligella urethralis]|uniref:efflux RND transporter periplasmic adaptor subunit n=1 Tax=Oligella urethralis TaxID=90245 RepID=UPI000DFF763F|nr:efflux RND transporter periplasmic adaptor subunit [Oligella urethralis]MDK6203067.1 efflux RND transporter periplasmic adaptor subunit [Oligella urethralis]SUA65790.1 Multidrug resistance protein MdtE precursor [Oligella urethralis]
MTKPPETAQHNQPPSQARVQAEPDAPFNKRESGKVRIIKQLVLLLLLGVIVFVVYALFFHEQADNNTASRPSPPAMGPAGNMRGAPGAGTVKVRAVAAEVRTMNNVIRGIGTALPSETVVVRSQVSGPLTQVFFEEGALVKAGDALFAIDPRPFEAKLQQTRAQYQQNEAQLANAEADLRRYQTLFKQNSIARQQVDTQAAQVKQLRASRASLQAQIDQAEIELEYTTVKAPISGRLGLRQVDIGNLVQANATEGLVTITQTQPMDVEFAISERYVPQVATKFYQGQPLEVQLYDRNFSQFIEQGVLLSMDNQIDAATGTVKVKARFDNANYALFPNQFVNVWLYAQRYDNSLSVLTDAIQHGRQGAFVFLINEDMTVQRQEIQSGIVEGVYTQVLEGLVEGDRVVIEGVDRLRAGSKVEIID